MLDKLNAATFAPLIGETFRVSGESLPAIDMELIEVTEAGEPRSEAERTPFSIVFLGPAEPVLPQRIYGFESDALGTFELFIVPLGPDEAGMLYEAVFG